jgi:hypothetical protein
MAHARPLEESGTGLPEPPPVLGLEQAARPVSAPFELGLSPEQAADEAVMLGISGTMLNIEDAIRRATSAHVVARDNPRKANKALVLERVITELQATRTMLFQKGYFGGDQQELF